MDAFDGMMVIDFGRFAKENPLLESRCQRRVLMGGLQPWEREAYATCIEKNKKKRSFKRKMVLGITPNTKFVYSLRYSESRIFQTVDKALLLQGFAIVGTAFLI